MERIKDAIEKAKKQLSPTTADLVHTQKERLDDLNHPVINTDYQQTKVAHIQPSHLSRNRIIAFDKTNNGSLSIDILRTQVLSKMEENGWRTLAITSPVKGCGKTVLAINLALSISQHTNKTTMLVDFDLRGPQVANYLGLNLDRSLNDVLEGDVAVSDALINPDIPRVVILPTARPFKSPSETLASKKTKRLIHDLRERYQERIVLFDLPPLLSADDVMTILPSVDCVLVIVANGAVTSAEMNESLRLLQGSNLLGVVLNKTISKTLNDKHS